MDLTSFNYEKEGKEYIYLVMVEYKDKTLLKVGYTKTLENRMDTYELHNPDFQLLKIREGTRGLEVYMHKKFEKYRYPKREEWFYYNEEIVEGFDTLEEMNFLDIGKLKNKIINLLKPKSIEELKKIYYERYQKEIEDENLNKEDLDYTITNAFSFINKNIKDFIDALDYSGIPLEINPETRYQVIIPNPISTVDISIDLEQLLGRQRLIENPWKDYAKVFIRTLSKKNIITSDKYYAKLNSKKKTTNQLLDTFKDAKFENRKALAETYQRDAKVSHYKYNYVSVTVVKDWETGEVKDLIPEFNNLMMISDMRAFEVQQVDYKDRFTVFSAVNQGGIEGATIRSCEMVEKFNHFGDSTDRLKYLADMSTDTTLTSQDICSFLEMIPSKYRDYYEIIGPERIKANKYRELNIKRELMKNSLGDGPDDKVISRMGDMFRVGHKYSKSGIKESLKKLYQELDYKKTAKATDLEVMYVMKAIKLQEDGKWVNGFEIIGKR